MITAALDAQVNHFWDQLINAGIAVAIGLVIWVVIHYLIRGLVKQAKSGRTIFDSASLKWAHPVLRTLDSERRVQRAKTIGSLLNSILTVIVVVVTGFYVLLAFNVDLTPLLTSIGILGIAIGFGCQQLIRDFLSGIFITIEDQFGIGDVIQTSEVIGTVESVGLRITRVRSDDGAIWYLRNGEILRLGNRSQGDYVDPEAHSDDDGGQPAGLVDPTQPQPQKADG